VEISVPCGHTAGPDPTSAERAVDFWNRLVQWCAEQRDHTRTSESFNNLTATLISMTSGNDGLNDRACLHIGLRLPPGIALDVTQAGARALLPEGRFCFSDGEPAVRGSKNTPLVACFLRAIRGETGEPRFKVKTGTADMNIVGPAWGCPMLAYGPGNSRLDHTPNEHVIIDEYLSAVRVLTRVLEEL
jgi:LysW-gamma-L-lysine carboxypeptidase